MSKVAHYLQEHLLGEVMTSVKAREYFSTDASVLTIQPSVIVYPRNENDVRKVTRFTWQLAERGRLVPVTSRGNGTDQTGAAIGSGIVVVFPAHMNKIVEFDSKKGDVIVEPGLNYGRLQQTLMTHGRFLPPYPASLEYSTVGGAVGNNASGEKSFKYGDTKTFVKGLRVVLANGEVIETGTLNKRELNKKLGLATFEGEIYRAIDTLIEENHKAIDKSALAVSRNVAGYNLSEVKAKEGFDLTPLFIGSQGTLGIITEIVFETEPYNSETSLLVGQFDNIAKLQKALIELREVSEIPCSIEMVDERLLELVEQINPNQLKDTISRPYPKVVLIVEFDDVAERSRKKMTRKAARILDKYSMGWKVAEDEDQKFQIWKMRQAVASVIMHSEGKISSVPVIEDGIVPIDHYGEYILGIYKILDSNHVKAAIWGHAGDANLHIQPFLNLSEVGDRQKLFRLMEEYYSLVIGLGGSTNGEHGEGRIQAPFLPKVYEADVYALHQKVKQTFDPYGTLNPGVKIGVVIDDVKKMLRHDYSLGPWFDYMPRT